MQKNIVKTITINALIVAIYCVLSLPFGQLNYGIINIRVSEIFMILCMFNKKFIPSLVIGCLLVNIFSGMPYDWIIGTFQTLLSCFALYYIKNKILSISIASFLCGLIIGLELHFVLSYPIYLAIGSVWLSELIILIVGYFVFKIAVKNETIKKQMMG